MRGRRGAPSLLPAAQPSAGAAAAGDGLWEQQPVLLAVVEPTHPSPAELSTASDGSWRGPEQPHCSQRTPRVCIRGGEDDAFAPELPTHLPPLKPPPSTHLSSCRVISASSHACSFQEGSQRGGQAEQNRQCSSPRPFHKGTGQGFLVPS